MERLSPKIEIINHFDKLINKVDIDIDSNLEKYNDKQLLGELLISSRTHINYIKNLNYYFTLKPFDTINTIDSPKQNLNSWTESTKVIDYLKQVRMKTIEELKKAQEETLEYFKINSSSFKTEQTIEELKSKLFAEKFYFQIHIKYTDRNRLWAFNVFTFVSDFYLPQSYIDSLEKLINQEEKPFSRDIVFDEKIVLTWLLLKRFIDNLLKFPNHVIQVRKEDVINIPSIAYFYDFSEVNLTSSSTIDLSKLVDLYLLDKFSSYRNESCRESVKFNIEGLSSLKTLYLGSNAKEIHFSLKNLPSLTKFFLSIDVKIDEDIVTRVFNQVPNIQELYLNGQLSYFNLDNFVNLKELILIGSIEDENFNFELFKNLCNQLETIKINLDEKTIVKLLDGYKFPYLVDFSIKCYEFKRFRKEIFNGFSSLRRLQISDCRIEVIEHDSFSNMQQLSSLDLSRNQIESIEENAFSMLKNLKTINLLGNKLRNFDRKLTGLLESVELKI